VCTRTPVHYEQIVREGVAWALLSDGAEKVVIPVVNDTADGAALCVPPGFRYVATSRLTAAALAVLDSQVGCCNLKPVLKPRDFSA